MGRNFVLALFLVAFFTPGVAAATLFGRVIEVNDGDVITVFNLNRPVRIKLLAVDAPEANQVFGDVAKKHLSDLVYDKSVVVEYWGIAADGSLVGRVLLDNADIGAQMIRDGAAWFDASNQGRLSTADREIYQQSEQAARTERRGLWQAETPVAPWEYVRAQALRRDPVATMNSVLPAAKSCTNRQIPELTNLSLMASRLPSGATANPMASSAVGMNTEVEDTLWISEDSGPKNWQAFKPEDAHFSVLVPDDGKRKQISVPIGHQTGEVNVYAARDGQAVYALMWISGPTYGESDKSAIDGASQGFLYGFAEGYKRRSNQHFSCEPEGEGRNISAGGFSGSEFNAPSCTIPAKVRIYSRVVGGIRQMYIAAVFFNDGADANVSRFLKSFTINASPRKTAAPKN